MECPKCQSETRVIDSRSTPKGTRRRRKCDKCGHKNTTYEVSLVMVELYESQFKRVKELEKQVHDLTKKKQGASSARTWTESEKQRLITLYHDNLPYRKIAEVLGRSYPAVDRQIITLRKRGVL